jgi:hypothetical protein
MKKANQTLTIKTLFFTVLIALSFTSCVKLPITKYDQLNNTTKNLDQKITDTYNRILVLQRRYVVTSAPDAKIDTNTFKPIIYGISYDLAPAFKFRESALDILAKYTNLLFVLSSKDYLKNADQAISDLSASTTNLSKNSLKLPAAESKIIGSVTGTIANTISKLIIEKKRIHTLKLVMDSTQISIQKLTDLLEKSDDKIVGAVKLMRKDLIGHANLIRPPYASLNRYAFDLEFANLLDEISDIEQSLEISNSALKKIPKSHAEIRKLLDVKDTKLEALQDLISEGQRIGDVYNNLNK